MLGRYTIVRGAKASGLPGGIRQDARKHTRHVLRPTAEMVERVLADDASDAEWRAFASEYRELLAARFAADRRPFDGLAALAGEADVWIGCSCPTAKNPDVRRCHTTLALAFMREHYPAGCCTPFCDASAADTCGALLPGTTCVPLFERGEGPEACLGIGVIGVCLAT